jgi:hypothetical protein
MYLPRQSTLEVELPQAILPQCLSPEVARKGMNRFYPALLTPDVYINATNVSRVVNSTYASAWTAVQNLFSNWSSI